MRRYADPERCPNCLRPIEYGATSCPTCGLSLEGPEAADLFRTLLRADELLARMQASTPSVVPAHAGTAAPRSPAPPGPTGGPLPEPRVAPEERSPWQPPPPAPRATFRARLGAASVPKILLALGALCLLVAALVFLAVAWSTMGVAGRTATLVAVTAVAAGLAGWAARRDLRAAAEALSVVALGLLAFDVVGARESGWLGDLTAAGFLVVLGAVLALAGTAAALAVRRTPAAALTGAQVIAGGGLALVVAGGIEGTWLTVAAALTLGAALSAAAALAARRWRLVALAVTTAVVAGYAWLALVAVGLDRAFTHATARELWLELHVWPLLAAAALAGATTGMRRLPLTARGAGLAAAELVLAAAALVPFTEMSGTALTLAGLGVLVVAGTLTWTVPTRWVPATAVTTGLVALWMAGVALSLTEPALARVLDPLTVAPGADPGSGPGVAPVGGPGVALPATPPLPVDPWLLPVTVTAVLAVAVTLARRLPWFGRAVAPLADPVAAAAVLAASLVGAVALRPVPVWLVLALLLACATASTVWALVRRQLLPLVAGSVFLAAGLALSLHHEWLTLAAVSVGLLLAGAVHLRWREVVPAQVAGAASAGLATALVWTGAALAGVSGTWAAAAALVLLALLAVGGPLTLPASATASGRPLAIGVGVELGAAASALAVSVAGVGVAPYAQGPTWTAVYLTVAGAAVSMLALLRADRRAFGWLGGLLLVAANWVRLWDIGVDTPEAYTLPAAVALTVTGLVHLRRRPDSTTMTALAPGLALGLVPSLLWVLPDPVSLRSALLGGATLAVLLAGVGLRWTAPVVVGAAVGAVLVVRHLTPVADALPRWVLIGAAGVVLIATGITWERRVKQARAALGYVRSLR